jgi:hypothetical protein
MVVFNINGLRCRLLRGEHTYSNIAQGLAVWSHLEAEIWCAESHRLLAILN